MLKFKTRYRFWHVFLVFLVMGGLYGIISYLYKNHGSPGENGPEIADPNKNPSSGIGDLLGFFYFVVFFYFVLNYYYNLIVANKRFLAFLKISAFIIFASIVYHSILYFNLPQALEKKYNSLGHMISSLISNTIPMIIIGFFFAYLTNMREAVKQRRILVEQKLQLESQISQANFNFLKAQINPHFLHNTLNFLYAKSLPYSAELSEGILTLSDIMRYALSQGNQKDGKAPLKDEIEHVNNVIKISQLRYNNQLKVNFEVKGEVNGTMIIPFVLITVVENAFKHGDLKNPDYPIDIKLNTSGNKLYFYCRNKKKTGAKQLSTGIGLENIKKRLDLAYGDAYKYIVKDEPEFYTTELTINKL